MKETQFNTEVMNSLKDLGVWCYKIADSPTSWTSALTRFTPEKPSDILACYKSKFVAIEGKQIKKFKAFGIGDMRPSQIRNMDEIVTPKVGGRAFVFLNIRIKAVKGTTKQENRLLILDWAEWRERLKKSSLKQKELMVFPFIQGRSIKDVGTRFDLKGFLEGL
jgi:hypothetical protein